MENNPDLSAAPGGKKSYGQGGWGAHAILITLSIIYLSDYADRFVHSSMISFIKADWNITDTQAGWLLSIVLIFITIFSLPASILIDRWSRRKMVSIMTFFWSIATLACAFSNNYWQLLTARAFIGIGESGYAPAGTAMLSAAYPEKRRALVMGIWNLFIPLGMGIGIVAGGIIAKRWGWQHAFGLVAVPGMLLAVAAWFLPDYKTVKTENDSSETKLSLRNELKKFIANLKVIFKTPSLVFTYLGFAMNVSITTALSQWLSSYFERTGMVKMGQGGTLAMLILGLVVFGSPLGGVLSDVWHKRKKEGRLYLPAVTSLMSAGLLFIAFLFPGKMLPQFPMLLLFGIVLTCFIAPGISVTQDVVHPGLRAFSYAMCVIVQHIAGDVWSPVIVGKLSDMIGLDRAVLFVPLYGVLASMFFFLASRYYRRDAENIEKIELEAE